MTLRSLAWWVAFGSWTCGCSSAAPGPAPFDYDAALHTSFDDAGTEPDAASTADAGLTRADGATAQPDASGTPDASIVDSPVEVAQESGPAYPWDAAEPACQQCRNNPVPAGVTPFVCPFWGLVEYCPITCAPPTGEPYVSTSDKAHFYGNDSTGTTTYWCICMPQLNNNQPCN